MVAATEKTEKLAAELVDAAIRGDEAVMAGDSKQARKQSKILVKKWESICEIGYEAKEVLAQQLHHPNPSARSAVAAFLLKFRHEEAMAVLKELAKGDGLVPFQCQEAIKRWEEGTWSLE